jgi:hypothetical protein
VTQSELTRQNKKPWILRAAATLVVLLSGVPTLAQVSQEESAQAAPKSLHIVILDGEGALNNIRERTAREPIIQVEDENHKPVSEAAVVFLIHGGNNGAGATFGGNSLSFATKTGPDGKAQTQGLQVGQAPGSFTITVTATVGTLVAESVIHQSNVLSALSKASTEHAATRTGIFGVSKVVAIVVGAAVVTGVVVGVVVATNSGNSTQVTTGPGTVGPPSTGAKPIH